MAVLVEWLSFCDQNPAGPNVRWDGRFLERILTGSEWRVPDGYTFVPLPSGAPTNEGRIVIFPCGHYKEHCGTDPALQRLERHLRGLDWSIVIATSDEGGTFPWQIYIPPPNSRLWVQTPRPERRYPQNTRFFGFGSPTSAVEFSLRARPQWEKTIEIFFSGQVTHSKRTEMWEAMEEVLATNEHPTAVIRGTSEFASGMPLAEYIDNMVRADVVLCPSGPLTQDTFRFYEALEAQAVPIFDVFRPDGSQGYWKMLPLGVGLGIGRWSKGSIEAALWARSEGCYRALTSATWQQEKRRLTHRLHDDIERVSGDRPVPQAPEDLITVVMVTSPTPHHPSTDMIHATLASVITKLPGAEVLIGIDGVREEQENRGPDYWEYARRLCAMTNPVHNICPYVFTTHMHQSGMTKALLAEVRTPFILFMEHDTPLVGEIDFDACLKMMRVNHLNSLRFMHETEVLEPHRHLFYGEGDGWLGTIQWSQRPHLARTNWYRQIMDTYFGEKARTMIEDVMHGVVQHGTYTARKQVRDAWKTWRMAVYAPEGDMKRSTHLDGRGDDPKYGMFVAYDHGRPEGAPPEGWL